MIMPKLELSVEKIVQFNQKQELENFFDELKKEQGLDFEMNVLMLSLVDIEFARGFCYAYFLVREALIKKSTDNLENMFKEQNKEK